MIRDIVFNSKSGEDKICPICQEDFNDKEKLKMTPCGHIFHPQCISQWLTKQCTRPTCPTCRHDCREEYKPKSKLVKKEDQ